MTTKNISAIIKVVTLMLAVCLCVLAFTISLSHDRDPEQNRTDPDTTSPSDVTSPEDSTTPDDTTAPPDDTETEDQPLVTLPPDESDPSIEDGFELPIAGSTGYASIPTNILSSADAGADKVGSLKAGECFRILAEDGDWWQIESGSATGWVTHKYCFINLPDIIPSIVYYDTNAFSSKFVSSGKTIPGITDTKLYDAYMNNERLGRVEFIMPVLYSMAPKIYAAQQAALAEDETLIIYETFRPRETQQKVVNLLTLLAAVDSDVDKGISSDPWSMTWFISTGVSNHQKGYAFDVSLGKVTGRRTMACGDYTYTMVTTYEEYTMPTPMHELSRASASMQKPVSSKSETAWRDVPLAESMNAPAIRLRTLCTEAGLTPLASEWWHFNDLKTAAAVADSSNTGTYYISTLMSVPPTAEG